MRTRMKSALALAVGVTIVFTGCGATSAPPATGDPTETIDLSVGILPIIDVAAFQVAIDEGFFEEENLNVTFQTFNSGSAVVAALTSGSLDIGWSAIVPDINALSQGVPIKAIAPGVFVGPGDRDPSAIVVAADSAIREPSDLEGRSISIVSQQSLAHFETLAALDALDVDITKVTFVEIPFPEIGAAIDAGRIDAGFVQEPFKTILEGQGMRIITEPISDILDEGEMLQTTEWITTDSFASTDPEAVERFQRAIAKANEFANENPDATRSAVQTLIPTLDESLVNDVNLSFWQAEVDLASYDKMFELVQRYGTVTTKPDFEAYLELTK